MNPSTAIMLLIRSVESSVRGYLRAIGKVAFHDWLTIAILLGGITFLYLYVMPHFRP